MANEVGLYGKLPSHGDFLRRRTSDAFVAIWDAWLQACIAGSRLAIGDRWVDVYLTSPIWRFTAAAGACGPAPLIGLMAPSVDRVGRYFPLTVVAELSGEVTPIFAATAGAPFFERAERLILETFDAEYVDFEQFDERVGRLATELAPVRVPQPVMLDPGAAAVLLEGGNRWHLPVGSIGQLATVFEQVLSHALGAEYEPLTLWWTDGSSAVDPSCLIARGLPNAETFAAFLDGAWSQHQWRTTAARIEMPTSARVGEEDVPVRFRSAAASDVGRVRAINQDSFIEHPENGLWVVADGLGGHSDGEAASRMVCDAFADFVQNGTFDDTIAAAADRIHAVNEQLVRAAARSLLGDRSGTTVVALLVRGSRCAILWAGDSRAYRWRAGRLDQLTRDHAAAAVGPAGAADSHAVTRAVGAQPRLDLDSCCEQVRAGDRYLLCSDGLTRVLTDAQIRTWVETPDIQAAVQGLIKATLDAGAPDNVTALLVEAYDAAL